jgi:hypothetical protein
LQVRDSGEVDDDFILWLSRDGLLSSAERARGIDPSKWVPHHERRQDVSGGEMTI